MVTKKLTQQLRNPAKGFREGFELIASTLEIITFLIDERLGDDTMNFFVDNLLKDDIVTLTAKLLSYVSEGLVNTPEQGALSEDASPDMVKFGLRILFRSVLSRSGQQCVALLFKLGFLSTAARILSCIRYSTHVSSEILKAMFDITFPSYLCHRFVVASAIKAVKMITIDGDIAKLEASPLKESWANFTSILLERTVINTVYERDFAVLDVRKCDNVCLSIFGQFTVNMVFVC